MQGTLVRKLTPANAIRRDTYITNAYRGDHLFYVIATNVDGRWGHAKVRNMTTGTVSLVDLTDAGWKAGAA